MKRIIITMTAALIGTFLYSCSKQDSKPSTDITGTWTFVSMDVNTNSATESSFGGETSKALTVSSYTTQNNTGTLVIDASTINSNNIQYTVNTTSKTYMYQDGAVMDSISMPFNFNAPVSSGSVAYTRVGADSIYSQQGSLFMDGVTEPTIPSGARLRLDGNTLYMTQTITQNSSQVVSGITVKNNMSATSVIRLQKQ